MNIVPEVDFTENDITISDVDNTYYEFGKVVATVYKQLWYSSLKREIKGFYNRLAEIAKKEMDRDLDKLKALDISVSKLYFNTSLDVNKGQGLIKGKPEYSIITGSGFTLDINWDRHTKCNIIETFCSEMSIDKYDTLTNQKFPFIYMLDTSLLEFSSINTKVISVDDSPRLFLIDIDSDKRQEVTIVIQEEKIRNLKYIERDKVKLHKNNREEFYRQYGNCITDFGCDITNKEICDYVMYRSDTNEYLYEADFDSWKDILVLDYLHRYGDILQKDLLTKDNKELEKYGWFATYNLNTIYVGNTRKLEYYVNMYRYCTYKLKKSKVKLSETEWRLVDKECIILNSFALDMYAKLENGHRIIAFDFIDKISEEVNKRVDEARTTLNIGLSYVPVKESLDSHDTETIHHLSAMIKKHRYEMQEKYGNTLKLLKEYASTKFGTSLERFRESQKNMLSKMIDNHTIKIFDNEKDMLDDLNIIDNSIECDSLIKIGFYSQFHNKFVSVSITQYNSSYWRLGLAYPFLEPSYPLHVGILSLSLTENNSDEKAEISRCMRRIQNEGSYNIIQLGNIIVCGMEHCITKIFVIDNLKHNTAITLVNREKATNLNERIKLINLTTKLNDNYDEQGIITTKLCKYSKDTDIYLSRHSDKYYSTSLFGIALTRNETKAIYYTSIDLVRV